MNKIIIKKEIIDKILQHFDSFSFEMGGALISKDNRIVDFIPLQNIEENKKDNYLFSFEQLNMVLSPYFNKGYDLAGFIHSHIGGCLSLSKNDKVFFSNFLKENSSYKHLITPIIVLSDKNKEIKWWMFFANGDVEELLPLIK